MRTGSSSLRNWSLGLLATAIAVVISYYWLDRPIAHLSHDELGQFPLVERIARAPDMLMPIAIIIVAMGAMLRGLAGAPLPRFPTVLMLSGISLAFALLIKDELKLAFGRTWPDTWVRNNPSLIRDNVYGFFPFHGGVGYSSFPSGHTTAICTVMTVLWLCYPKFRLLYALAIAGMAIGLVGANFHFLSDVIAGAFLGVSVGWASVVFWENGTRRVRPGDKEPDAAE